MRRILYLLVISTVGWLSLTESAAAAVSVVLPNGGECLTVGQAYTITVSFDTDHVALYYRTDGTQPTHLQDPVLRHPLNPSTWNWTPVSADISETGRIWVEGHFNNHDSANQWDQSNANFSVRNSCAPPPPPVAAGVNIFATPPSIKYLTVSEITTSSAVISWQTDRYTYYKFSYGKSSGNYTNTTSTGPPYSDRADHKVILTNLEEGATYYFQIIAGLYQPEPAISKEQSFRTLDRTPPGQVMNTFGIAGASTTLISWLNPTDPDFKQTKIVSRTDRFPEHKNDGEIVFVGNDTYYADSGLTNGASYYYSIFTSDFSDNIGKPVNIALVPRDNLPEAPTPPVGAPSSSTTLRISLLSSRSEENTISLSWSNPKDQNFLGVQVVRSTSSLPSNPYDGDVIFRGRVESLEDSGLLSEQRYQYGLFLFDWKNNFYQAAFISEITKPPKEVIEKLKSRIEAAKQLIEELTLSIKIVNKPGAIRLGARGEEVKMLQEILAKRQDLYPEGLVTGYFGPLTRRAVQRFQKNYGIVSYGDEDTTGYGSVGPQTKEKLPLLLSRKAIPEKVGAEKEPRKEPKKETYNVYILPNSFSPQSITVPVGATVSWQNQSGGLSWVASDDHPTHTIYPEFDALRGFRVGEVYSFTFKRVGRWGYHSHLHPEKVGTVIVR